MSSSRGSSSSPSWHSSDESSVNIYEPAQDAFREGIKVFKESLTRDPKKRQLVDQFQACTLEDLLNHVVQAQNHYQTKHTNTKVQECITAFSKRVSYYGVIMDVMVQHHPEYVALAWGAMKLLFGAIVEHERTGTAILTALSDIGDALPRIELTLSLYPTPAMKQAVAMLYAHIVRFLVRALKYYEESRLTRAVHSITRPASLRYDDLIKMIQQDSQNIAGHASVASQAELREMHNRIRGIQDQIDVSRMTIRDEKNGLRDQVDALTELVFQIRQSLIPRQELSVSLPGRLQDTLSDIQMTQMLSMVSSQCNIDHKSTLQANLKLHNRHRFGGRLGYKGFPFWSSSELQDWNSSQASSAILISGIFRGRQQLMAFCVDIIEQLVKARTAILWVLVAGGESYALVDVLKSLILQALSLCNSNLSCSEDKQTFQIREFINANFEEDYLGILASALQSFKLVYIIFNAESMSRNDALNCRKCLCKLMQLLSERNSQTMLKIITAAYGPGPISEGLPENLKLRIGRLSRRMAKKQMRRQITRHSNNSRQTTADRATRPCIRDLKGYNDYA